jgi:hypothetical protein
MFRHWKVETPMRRFGCGHIGGGHVDHELSRRAHKSQKQEDRPSQGIMWTVDLTPCRNFRIESWRCQRILTSRIPKSMCEILTEPEPSDQDVI